MCLQSLQQDIEVKVSFKAVGNPLNYLIRADAAHQLMCLLSFLLWVCCSFFCIYCCWMCIILCKSVLIVTFLYFFFFFLLGGSVISRNQTLAGSWLMVVRPPWLFLLFWSDFFVLALSFYVDGTNSWLFECWFLMLIVRGLVDCCCLQARTLLSGELSAECTSYHVKAKLGSASDVTPSSFSLTWLHDEKVNEKVNVSSKKVKAGSCEAVLPSPRSYGNRRHAFFLFNF